MAVNWCQNVNTDAYGMDDGADDNLETVTFESGKKRTFLKNSAPKMIFTFTLNMKDDKTANCEYRRFWEWWKNTLLSGSLSFYFPNLLTHSGYGEYKMTAVPSANGQKNKVVTISVEEQ